jgi:hypothetical protein
MPEPENNRPENQPPQPVGKPYSVRRVNNVPLVIGFCLVAAFVAIVFLVVLPSNDSARKETKTKIVSAEGEAAAINAGAPSGFVPARSAPTPPAPVPTPEPIAYRLPSVLQPTPDDRLATLKQALSFRTRSVNIEHPVAYQAAPAATPQPLAAPAPENYGAVLARARALQDNGTPEQKKEATALVNRTLGNAPAFSQSKKTTKHECCDKNEIGHLRLAELTEIASAREFLRLMVAQSAYICDLMLSPKRAPHPIRRRESSEG